METEGVEAANKLVCGGKELNQSYLVGRLIRKKERKSKTSQGTSSVPTPQLPDELVTDITAKIRAELEQEMDKKLDQKLRQMMKLLADKNPDLKVDSTGSDSDKTGTQGEDDGDSTN